MVEFLIFLALGTILMALIGLKYRGYYGISRNKSMIGSVLLVISGVIGAYTMAFIENRSWGGQSFYGAPFLIPFMFIIVSFILKVDYVKLMDINAPQQCMMLCVLKLHCLYEGCCGGKQLCTLNEYDIYFPSQILESINVFLIMLILLYLVRKNTFNGKIYPIYLILYGITRFILNFGRKGLTPIMLGLSYGHIWSIISILAGIAIYLYLSNKDTMQKIAQAKQN